MNDQPYRAKCERCTNGNHTGTNGTPGCEGGACRCACSGNPFDQTADAKILARVLNGIHAREGYGLSEGECRVLSDYIKALES